MENQKSAPVYQVVEKFVSINGEGRRAGELAVFIRMKGKKPPAVWSLILAAEPAK